MKKILLSTFVIVISGLSSSVVEAQLSPKAIFHRCYKQITQSYPSTNHALINDVVAGRLDPIAACMRVFDKASLTANGNKRIGNTGDPEALNVLRTMQQLHHSWLTNKTFPLGGLGYLDITKDIFDYSAVSLYYTRALLAPNYKFSDVFKGNSEHLWSDRTNNSPERGPIRNFTKTQMPYKNNTVFAPKGVLKGITTYTQKRLNYVDNQDNDGDKSKTDTNTTFLDIHWGGGVLGSDIYVTMNADVGLNYRANGTTLMHRKWAKNVFHDFLCRELPVVRYSDAQPFVDSGSPIAFRNEVGCTACHVSMDRAASVIRTANGIRQRNDGSQIVETYRKHGISQGAESEWPKTNDGNFYRRPENGTFFFRTHNGNLIDQEISGAQGLGDVIASIDAPYICAAKRYYQYFTGVNANIDDIADPQYPNSLSSSDEAHRREVIQLGMQLKQHQSLRRLVEDILKKPQFKNSGYNITN